MEENNFADDKVIDENVKLLNDNDDSDEKKKDDLVKILRRLKKQLKEKNSINEAYGDYLNDEDIIKRSIKTDCNEWLLRFMFYIIAPLFTIINLIGIFQIISVQKAVLALFTSSLECYFFSSKHEQIKKDYVKVIPFEFFHFIYEESKKESIDFNLTMLMSFLGNMLLKSCGFIISSILFFLINFLSFFILIIFSYDDYADKEKLQYNIFKIVVLGICFLILFTGVGASALLSQKILIDSFSKYKFLQIYIKKKIETSDKLKSKFTKKEKDNDSEEKDEILSINNDSFSESKQKLSNMIISRIEKKDKKIQNIENYTLDFFFLISITTILGHYGKYLLNNLVDIILFKFIKNEKKMYKYFFGFIYIIYSLSIFASLGLYFCFVKVFTKKEVEDNKGNKYRICKLCGYIIYSETINLDENKPKCECCKLSCESLTYCCYKAIYNMLDNEDDDVDDIKSKCCTYCNYNKNDYNKKKEFFCYCYQEERKSNWCKKFFTNKTQKTIGPYMIEYFIMQLSTIAFQKNYNEISKTVENELKIYSIIFPLTLFWFFYLTLTFSKIIQIFKNENDERENKNCVEKVIKFIEKFIKSSNEILNGTHSIFFFNGIASLIISFINFSKLSDTKLYKNIFEERSNFILIPILLNRFYYFALNYFCIRISEKEKGFELISGSTLISLYIFMWEIIVKFIIYLSNDTALFIIQIISSIIPFLIFIGIIFILFSYIIYNGLRSLFHFLLIFMGGGICYDLDYCLEGCYFFNRVFYCECCCCDLWSPYFCDCCFNNCYDYKKCCCCDCYDFFRYCMESKWCIDYSLD